MRFSLAFMGMEVFGFEFAWPSRGVYPVPDFYDIPSEEEILDFGPHYGNNEDEL